MVINKNYLINGRAESASRTGRDVGQVGRVRRVRGLRRLGGLGGLGGLREVRQVGVRAKASECMELGMWGRLWDEWAYFSVFVVYHL